MNSQKGFVILLCLFNFVRCAYDQYVGNPDDTAKIERPCPTFDLNCIRVFFQNHAHCRTTFGPIPDPINRPQYNLVLPRVNLTTSAANQKVQGLGNGRVEEFYINRETDNLVIAINFRNMTQINDNSYFRFNRRGKEPIVTVADEAMVIYESLIITAVIPKINDLQLKHAECTTFCNDAVVQYFISPTALQSDDPQVLTTITQLVTNIPITIQEIFLTDSSYFIATYIQYNICDFGLFLT